MTEPRGPEHWDGRYREGNLPWDTGQPEERLIEVVREVELAGRSVVDLGCGAGTNAIELARMGFNVVGVDISGEAVEMARQRADQLLGATAGSPSSAKTSSPLTAGRASSGTYGAAGSVRFEVASIVEGLPIEPGSVAVAVDRGCFHSVDPSERAAYIEQVAEVLIGGGWWLLLCGNADEPREEGATGPPQLTAAELAAAVEGKFEIRRLERSALTGHDGQVRHIAWRGVFCKR